MYRAKVPNVKCATSWRFSCEMRHEHGNFVKCAKKRATKHEMRHGPLTNVKCATGVGRVHICSISSPQSLMFIPEPKYDLWNYI